MTWQEYNITHSLSEIDVAFRTSDSQLGLDFYVHISTSFGK